MDAGFSPTFVGRTDVRVHALWSNEDQLSSSPIHAGSSHFEQPGRAHPAADAHRDHNVFNAAPLALDQRMPGHPRSAHPVRMSNRNRATIHVEPLVGNTSLSRQ